MGILKYFFQLIIGAGLAHWEQYTIYNLLEKIKKMEDSIESETSPEYMEKMKNKSESESLFRFEERKPKYGVMDA